jgi:hypothetical protein
VVFLRLVVMTLSKLNRVAFCDAGIKSEFRESFKPLSTFHFRVGLSLRAIRPDSGLSQRLTKGGNRECVMRDALAGSLGHTVDRRLRVEKPTFAQAKMSVEVAPISGPHTMIPTPQPHVVERRGLRTIPKGMRARRHRGC